MKKHRNRAAIGWLALVVTASAVRADDFPKFEAREIDPRVGNVCYALTIADVNGDKKPDIVAATEDAVVWFVNPTWEKRTILKGETERDNVCIQAGDLNGDGRVDFVLGAAWRPTDTKTGGSLQWLEAVDSGWKLRPIASEPTLHRIRLGDVLGLGRDQLIAAPLQGRGTKGPNWNEGNGSRIMVFAIPKDPLKTSWPMEVADQSLHAVHNLQVVDFDGDGRNDILLAAWEGVFLLKRDAGGLWSKTRLGIGNQEAKPFKGSSEIKLGKLKNGERYIATIEPWHGFQVVVYTPPKSTEKGVLWDRRVVDEPLQWGHAVWCADLDGDGDDELIIGQRDPNRDAKRSPKGPGVFVYDPKRNAAGALEFDRHVIDDGGVAVEDALAADLDGDGRPEIVAGGRATHNVKIYWNKGTGASTTENTDKHGKREKIDPNK